MKKLLIFITTVTLWVSAMAQEPAKSTKKNKKEEKKERINAMARAEEEGLITHKKHFAFGLKLTTDGYGMFFEKGYAKSIQQANLFQLEFAERKHRKEEKQSNPYAPTAPIIYGKLNYFYQLKLGMQRQFLLGNKSNKNGVSITTNLGGGLTLAFLRAYEVEVDKNGDRTYVRYDSPDSLLFVNGPYYGGPTIGVGWNHLKVIPGLYLKPALRFDYGRFNDVVRAIEVGLNAEFYAKKVPQMLYNKEYQFFFGAYFSLVFGRRK
jgi:hypothetical protein